MFKRGRTEFVGVVFDLKDGAKKFVKPHPEVKKNIEELLNKN